MAAGQQVNVDGLTVETVIGSGLSKPTHICFIGSGDMLVCEQSTGKVKRIIDGVLQPGQVLDLPVAGGLEPGLHGINLHPDFPDVPHVFLYYTRSTQDNGPRIENRVARFTWTDTLLDPASEFVVTTVPAENSSHHG